MIRHWINFTRLEDGKNLSIGFSSLEDAIDYRNQIRELDVINITGTFNPAYSNQVDRSSENDESKP